MNFKKKIFLLSILFFTVSFTFYHTYFFAFAEIEYKAEEKKIECTLIFTAHDLETDLKNSNIIDKELEFVSHDSTQLKKMETYLLKNFKIINNKNVIPFQILDFELKKNGLIQIYFLASDCILNKEFEIEFSSLMDVFPRQQNKITFINQQKKTTAVFLKNKHIQKITI